MKVKVTFGGGNVAEIDLNGGATAQDAIEAAKGLLGLPENVSAVVDGVHQAPNAPLADGDEVKIVQKSCEKAG